MVKGEDSLDWLLQISIGLKRVEMSLPWRKHQCMHPSHGRPRLAVRECAHVRRNDEQQVLRRPTTLAAKGSSGDVAQSTSLSDQSVSNKSQAECVSGGGVIMDYARAKPTSR
jgi:hypothetical protein